MACCRHVARRRFAHPPGFASYNFACGQYFLLLLFIVAPRRFFARSRRGVIVIDKSISVSSKKRTGP
jgi:hypothetical protein